MEIQPVLNSGPNVAGLFPSPEPQAPIKPKEPICFYCKLPRSQCTNQDHWNKKLATDNLSVNRAQCAPDGKHFVTVSCVPGDEAFERIQGTEIEKEIGRVTPEGQSPDPEDSNLHSTLDLRWLEKEAWQAADRLEQAFVLTYIRNCPDVELAIRWSFAFPEYMQGMLLAQWSANHPAEVKSFYDAVKLAGIIKEEALEVECLKCGRHSELRLEVFGNAILLAPPTFVCADCLGRFKKDFEPRSKLRKWPRCRRARKSKSAATMRKSRESKKWEYHPTAVAFEPPDFDVYTRLVLAAGGYGRRLEIGFSS